jgi:hypothetical protein
MKKNPQTVAGEVYIRNWRVNRCFREKNDAVGNCTCNYINYEVRKGNQ